MVKKVTFLGFRGRSPPLDPPLVNSVRSNLCRLVIRKWHRENREIISIVKSQLINLPVFWLAHYISVCVTITPRIASKQINFSEGNVLMRLESS